MISKSGAILLSHPGVGQFTQQVARALVEGGMLAHYYTTLVYRPDELKWRALCRLAKMIGLPADRLLRNRQVRDLPEHLIVTNSWREIIRAIAARLDRDGSLADGVWAWSEQAFDRWVSQQLRPGLAAVYGYENAALLTFMRAKELGLACIYEVPSPDPIFFRNILSHELERCPELKSPYLEKVTHLHAERVERKRVEWELADLVIVNSKHTRDTYRAAGMDVDKVRIVPLGAPPVRQNKRASHQSGPLKMLWAGNFSFHKGARYLLEATRVLGPRCDCELDVYGAVHLPERLLCDLPDWVHFHGPIPQSELFSKYEQAELLVLPSLFDGFGMVVTEAMAHGLVVVTTPNTGASELIRDGESGILVPAGDADALASAIERCLANREKLVRIGNAARQVASDWQWDDFRAALRSEIENFLEPRETA